MLGTYELKGGRAREGSAANHRGEGTLLSAERVDAAEGKRCSALHF